jgi:hypothetical protein
MSSPLDVPVYLDAYSSSLRNLTPEEFRQSYIKRSEAARL